MSFEKNLLQLQRYIEKEKFRGFDPYDALNSPWLRFLSGEQKYIRIAWTQFMKHCPINLRPLLGIKKDYNPKGLGLFLAGYAKLYQLSSHPHYLSKMKELQELLQKCISPGYSGSCWGYNFDWQSRAFYLPRGTPTIVNSSFIGHALLDAYDASKDISFLEQVLSIPDFLLKDLHQSHTKEGVCFSYTPLDQTTIHNANLLGASLLIRLQKYSPLSSHSQKWRECALQALSYTMHYQKENGSWSYAQTKFQQWIDSFHTGFNLQSMLYFFDEEEGLKYQENFYRGVKFYQENFFLPDGQAKYYHNRLYPLDIHAPAQAIVFFSRLDRLNREYRAFTTTILEKMIADFQDKKGYFYFQKQALWSHKIPYIRWAQSWAFHALTEYLLVQRRETC